MKIIRQNMTKYGALFIGCFLCSRITVFKMTLPVSAAICSAFAFDVTGISGMLGALLGLLSLGTLYDSLNMFCCCLIIIGVRIALDNLVSKYAPFVAFLSVMVTGIASLPRFGGASSLVRAFLLALLAGVTAYAIVDNKKRFSKILIYAYIVTAILINDFLGISIALIVLLAGASYGVCDDLSFSVLTGAVCGLGLSFHTGFGAVLPVLSAVCHLVLKKSRALSKALFFGVISFTLAVNSPTTAVYRIVECVIAYLISLALPVRKKKAKTVGNFDNVADIICDLQSEFEGICSGVVPGGEADISKLCDEICDNICITCPRRDECWVAEFSDTTECIGKALHHLKCGTAMTPDLLSGRLYGCIRGGEICERLNEVYRSNTSKKVHMPSVLAAAILRDLSAVYEKKEPKAKITVNEASRTKGGEGVSGDNVSVFCDRGRQIVLLSDGMGSGEAARRYSVFVCDAVKKLVSGGISPETALLLVGDMLGFAEGDWFVAADMLVIDLQTLKAELIKAGGAPSLLQRKNKFFDLSGSTLPLGIGGGKTEKITLHLKDGDTLLLFSDGVTDFDDNCAVITGIAKNCEDSKNLPKEVISSLSQVAHDDMSVVAVTINS